MAETAWRDIAFLEGARGDGMPLPAAPSVVVVGMPELTPSGLSETWLLKFCGHRHWLMLASAFGRSHPDFVSAEGLRLYPTFVSIGLQDLRLDDVLEGERLIFEGSLTRLSATRFASRQTVRCQGRVVAVIEMISVFVYRREAGCNEKVARDLPFGCHCLLAPEASLPALAVRHHALRRSTPAQPSRRLRLEPCPLTDFNGAGFLYFASFQTFLERADWRWHKDRTSQLFSREIHYFANVGPDVGLAVELLAEEADAEERIQTARIRRLSDGALLAIALTRKVRPSP